MVEAGAPSEPVPRLIIQRMELENFKSYAGKVEIGPFDKNMSSVVGPNGSGKSNVIDSMLFVFGWKSGKLRQDKIADLIHNSDRFPNLEYAKVSVYFQKVVDLPDGGHRVVPGSGLVVARDVRKDNKSDYWINNKKQSFATVRSLLREEGIDLDHNRFLILQGEVEAISMMKPKALTPNEEGLLEYLEDIIGSNRHVKPIEEAHAKIESLNEQRTSRLNALKGSEKEMQALEPGKAEAEQYVLMEGQLNEKRSAMYQKYAQASQANVDELEEKRTALEAGLADERQKHQEMNGKLGDLEKAHKHAKRDHDKTADQLEKRCAPPHGQLRDQPHPAATRRRPHTRCTRPRPPDLSPHAQPPPDVPSCPPRVCAAAPSSRSTNSPSSSTTRRRST